ncbi:alpha/beta-hydrolase [Apiospora aurea]|uniref:Alpha/beta-hydrolase n=1 Tax=Apiospora aurea TaxID=335848 RepID=A0ABR1QP38_9PEZI
MSKNLGMQGFESAFPTVAEVVTNPAFPTALWHFEPHQSGLLPVAADRGGPIDICWEVHGDGPIKLVLICGLGFPKWSWQRQTLYFGHDHGDKYSVLIMDNRGSGHSSKPFMRYSTSEMARDVLEVIGHLGWTEERQLHAVGISMGGMIAQELAMLVPERLASLNLLNTAARIENTTSFAEDMSRRITMLMPKSFERTVTFAASKIFAQAWLDEPDECHIPDVHTTPRVRPPKQPAPHDPVLGNGNLETGDPPCPANYGRFRTNYERFAAQEIHKSRDAEGYTKKGFLLQLVAAGFHWKSPKQLKELADRVGRERILVVHGVEDDMIPVPHGRKLIEYLEPAEGHIVEGMGHAPIMEKTEWIHGVLEQRIAVGEKLSGRG